jgi:hypothetical protein
MKLSEHSKDRLLASFALWDVDQEYAGTMVNYLVHGFPPGSFFTALLANDFIGAVRSSHPANTINALKKLSGWINAHMPKQAWGSYAAVNAWLELEDEQRREVLEQAQLIYSSKEEVWLILKDEPTETPWPYNLEAVV